MKLKLGFLIWQLALFMLWWYAAVTGMPYIFLATLLTGVAMGAAFRRYIVRRMRQ